MHLAVLVLPLALAQGGLQKEDVSPGKGIAAKAGDYVTVHYTGKLADGKQFDSSVGKEPFKFILGIGEVIKGWDLGVAGMKEGGKRKLVIPSELGYGKDGAGEDIPPNATLNFDVELLKIERLDMKVLKEGKGEAAAGGDTVQVHYRGTFPDGKQFDASYDRGTPMPVVVGRTRLIPGFTMALVGIKAGEKRKVTLPPHLAYGSRAVGPIPANSTLVFEVEAMKLEKAK